jgi:pyruvate/2-oxoglutarate dehydrogenase complex dihydrolipoamide acyltransferase (E2) component
MIQGPEPGSIYRLPDNRITTIGRSSQNIVTVVNRAVSRFHCEVACVNGRWELTDLNSRRGTMVNHEWVTDNVTLHFGDTIRMSSVVFRFDAYEEGVDDRGGLLGIKEAELDAQLVPKGEAEIGMQEIIQRSRMESKRLGEERRSQRVAMRTNMRFLVVVAAATLLGLAGTLLWAHGFVPGLQGVKPPSPPANQPADATADQPQEPDNRPAPPPEAPSPPAQDMLDADQAWGMVQQAVETARRERLQTQYAAALQALQNLADRDDMPPAPRERVRRERQVTQAMAKAWYEHQSTRAAELAEKGQTAEAAEIYALTARRVGIPELARQAREKRETLTDTP